MKISCLSSFDRISELPISITENILLFLPLKEAGRTSILSKNWRHQWKRLPHLVFDETFGPKSHKDPRDIWLQIYYTMLLHEGPILKFTLSNPRLISYPDIDKIILFLARKGVQELTLRMWGEEHYELPSYIFSCLQQLRHLRLQYFVFKLPPTFRGFSKLISLELQEVDLSPDVYITSCPLLERLTLRSFTTIDHFCIDAPNLKILCLNAKIKYIGILNSPLLATLSLNSNVDLAEHRTLNLIDLFRRLPLIQNLQMNCTYLKLLRVFRVEKKLPVVLNYLRILELSDICLTEMGNLSAALCLIRSSPNLQKIMIKVLKSLTKNVDHVLEYLKSQDYCDASLNKLHEVEIEGFTRLRPEVEFIMFLLAISPNLETLRLKSASSTIIKRDSKILSELKKFRRASQKAEIIILSLNGHQA